MTSPSANAFNKARGTFVILVISFSPTNSLAFLADSNASGVTEEASKTLDHKAKSWPKVWIICRIIGLSSIVPGKAKNPAVVIASATFKATNEAKRA